MKNFLLVALAVLMLGSCRKEDCVPAEVQINDNHPVKTGLQTIIDKYTAKGIPGIQVAVKDRAGWYTGAGGYADIATQAPMKGDSTTWLFSITKTYTAALIMKLREIGQLNLDSSIAHYLPAAVSARLKKSSTVTVRMLLNHSSGYANFIELDTYRLRQFTDPLNQPTVTEILEMIYGEGLMFDPGSESYYSNTNYLLLGQIIEKLTGRSYEAFLRSQIINRLALKHTYFNPGAARIAMLGFPSYYTDLEGNGQVTNSSAWNGALGRAGGAWGGLAARPTDAILFYEALVKGRVVNTASLEEMKKYKNDYGLGIESYQYKQGSVLQFGHEGDGVGNSTMILYVPANEAFIFINATVGRQLPGPFLNKIIDLKNEICSYVANR